MPLKLTLTSTGLPPIRLGGVNPDRLRTMSLAEIETAAGARGE